MTLIPIQTKVLQMLKPFLILKFLIILSYSYSQNKTELIGLEGNYKNCKCNRIIRLFKYSDYIGATLTINKDGKYLKETCAEIEKGLWTHSGDTLSFQCTDRSFKVDSLNKVGFNGLFLKCPQMSIQCKIKKNYLIFKESGKTLCFCK